MSGRSVACVSPARHYLEPLRPQSHHCAFIQPTTVSACAAPIATHSNSLPCRIPIRSRRIAFAFVSYSPQLVLLLECTHGDHFIRLCRALQTPPFASYRFPPQPHGEPNCRPPSVGSACQAGQPASQLCMYLLRSVCRCITLRQMHAGAHLPGLPIHVTHLSPLW